MKRHLFTLTIAAAGIMPFVLPPFAEAGRLMR
jgi:hypothetical protein